MSCSDDRVATSIRMSDYDYDLPDDLIAQIPLADRASSRLMVIDRRHGELTHSRFADLGSFLRKGDLLVLNDSRVIPARLRIRRQTGGRGELLLLERSAGEREWIALARPFRKLRGQEAVEVLSVDGRVDSESAMILEKIEDGTVRVRLGTDLDQQLDRYGRVPLPPYIRTELQDSERYQTVYSDASGSAAAPTAGLHFTRDMLSDLVAGGIEMTPVTLHVGLDTFRPVTEDIAEDHEIHSEWCSVPQVTIDAIWSCRERGGRVIAVGTTSARTLETIGARSKLDELKPYTGSTRIFITPGYRWKLVDAMITNFHLPRSTLLLMVCSFAGRELIFRAYQEAMVERYRFFSFGDATLIL